jgi:hypothetical protein
MDDTTIDGLLRVLFTTLNRDLMTGLNPETLLSMGNEKREDAKETTTHLVLIGASHLRRTIAYLWRLGYDVTDVTKPGRLASAAAVGEVLGQLRGTTVPVNAAVVIDMLGNSSSRWEQEDGTLATAVKLGSGYHMPGEVTVCNDETFKKLIGIVAPILSFSAGLSKIVIPPLLRYVFDTCCTQDTHCTNVRKETHAAEILQKADHLRNVLKSELNRLGVPNFRVTEGWTSLLGAKYSSRQENVNALRHLTAADGVHFTRDGYENLAMAIHNSIMSKDKLAAVVSRAGNGRMGTFFWRGFISPNGSARPKFSAAGYSANKRTRPHLHKNSNKRGRKN